MKYKRTTPSYTQIKEARNFFITGEGKVFKKTKEGMIELVPGNDRRIFICYNNGHSERKLPATFFLSAFKDTMWFREKYKLMDTPYNNYYIDGDANVYHKDNVLQALPNMGNGVYIKEHYMRYYVIGYRKLFLRYYVYATFPHPFMGNLDNSLVYDIDTKFDRNDERDELDVRKMVLVKKGINISGIGMKEYDDFGLKISEPDQTANRIYGFMVGPDSPAEPVSPGSSIQTRRPIAVNFLTGEFPEGKVVDGIFYQKLSIRRYRQDGHSTVGYYDDYWLTPEDLISNKITKD